ncbi:MAG TPA: sialidase family protein [Bryobacteraceae bacterium]|nr:sialidase family protein [Bryobacteraceae bacterium]
MASRILQPEGATGPSRQPHLTAGPSVVAMSFGSGSSIYYTSSSDGGRTFRVPSKVAETGALALGRHRGPRVAFAKDAIVISAFMGEKTATGPHAHGLPEAGNLTAFRSTDGGRTWKQAAVINDMPGAAREGLHAMASGPDGSLFAIWLDLRTKHTQLYGSKSTDGGMTWSKNVRVYASPDGTICECCHPSLSIDSTGRIWAMWRNALGGSRDLYVTSSNDGVSFDSAKRLGEGTWKLEACPMDGGGFAVDNGKVTSAWRRDGDVYLTDAGTKERLIGSGKDVALARGKRGAYVAWTKDGGVQILIPGASSPSQLTTEGGFVSLLGLADGAVLAAWEERGGIETKRLE